jgi:hypothetical protein
MVRSRHAQGPRPDRLCSCRRAARSSAQAKRAQNLPCSHLRATHQRGFVLVGRLQSICMSSEKRLFCAGVGILQVRECGVDVCVCSAGAAAQCQLQRQG